MSVKDFETMLNEKICEVKRILEDNNESTAIYRLPEIIREAYTECTNNFEEQCVTERITEVITEWVETMKAA